jgi:predicted CopG family antitoxin
MRLKIHPTMAIINTIITIVIIMSETTTIQIAKETRDALKEIGSMGDNYDKVIQKLITEHKRHNLEKDIQKWDKLIKEHPEEFVSLDDL